MSDDLRMQFVYGPDAWYWQGLVERAAERQEYVEREMSIVYGTPDDGCEWELQVVERLQRTNMLRGPATGLDALIPTKRDPGEVVPPVVLGCQVTIFDEAWRAFAEQPALFAGLAALSRPGNAEPTRLEEVRDLCLQLGFVDDTPRTKEHWS